MHRRIILLTKDAMGKYYLPVYGNKIWKTPNIDELASKGTVFNRHYTAAPCTSMSYYSMFTEQYNHQSSMKTYRILPHEEWYSGETLFDKAEKLGYECHIAWPESWNRTTKVYCECFSNAIIHPLDNIKCSCGVHTARSEQLHYDAQKAEEAFNVIKNCIQEICELDKDIFLWMHLPHVWSGYTGYGSDIEEFDKCVGYIRQFFPDDGIFISADHGNMNGQHGKLGYAFDLYESATAIPLITPKIENLERVDFPTVNIDLFSIIFERKIPNREVIYSDTAYYAQQHRKMAVIHGKYKYIYSNQGKKEELYDVIYDPFEQMNLFDDHVYDSDRDAFCTLRELYYYPNWEQVEYERIFLKNELKKVWKKPNTKEKIRGLYEMCGKKIKRKINYYKAIHKSKNQVD